MPEAYSHHFGQMCAAGPWVLLALALVSSGCQSTAYQARRLPPEFGASVVPDLRSVDLGQLGGQTYDGQRVYVGDVLDVQLATGIETEKPNIWQLRVREDGAVDVPLVGPVSVASLDLPMAEQAIRTASVQRQVFRHPAVGVAISQRRENEITVAGAVKNPKTYRLPYAGSTLMSALMAAGGLDESANRYIEIRQQSINPPVTSPGPNFTTASYPMTGSVSNRGTGASGEQVMRVDLLSAVANGGGDIYLNDGAVVTVEKQEPRFVHVIGLVRTQQRVEIPPGENLRLTDALAMAGGTSMSQVIAYKVMIIRKRPETNDTIVIKASLKEAKRNSNENILLAADDVISVEETPITFTLGTLQGLLGLGVNGLNQLR